MPSKERKPTGPEPERLKIEGDWKQAVQKVLKNGKPAAPKALGKRTGRTAK